MPHVPRARTALSTAITLAIEDPEVGPLRLRKGWQAEVVGSSGDGADRILNVRFSEGIHVSLMRFNRSSDRPGAFPNALPFAPSQVAWVADDPVAAVWISPSHPEDVAAAVVTESVQMGWALETGMNMRLLPRMNVVAMTRGTYRRSVAILDTHVILTDDRT